MKKFSRASREISVTLICILACFFSAFDIAEGIFFQRLLISAGGSWGGAGHTGSKRNFLSKSRRFRQICRNCRAQILSKSKQGASPAGGSWPLAGEGRFEVIWGPDPAYICRPQRGEPVEDVRHLRHACTVELGTLRHS